MKGSLLAALVAVTATAAALAADVGDSAGIGQAGFYGRIDVRGYPLPHLVYDQPVAVDQVAFDRPPIYMRVPPGYAGHWSKHCREYNACDERVLFVEDDWYRHEFAPRYREHVIERDDGRQGDSRENHGTANGDDRRGDEHVHGRDR